MKKVIYPRLTQFLDLGFIRISGPGLANCMIISAQAYIFSKINGYKFIEPTWRKISIGPFLRREKDKRHYFGLFNSLGVSGISKLFYLFLFCFKNKNIIKRDDLGNYFEYLGQNYKIAKDYFDKIINKEKLKKIENINFHDVIGIHIRLGDYKGLELKTDLDFYLNLMLFIKEEFGNDFSFFVFSDGEDKELQKIISINGVKKVFFGNALADMIALSKCKLIIASDSTFSGLAAFLNQTPIIFPKRHFGKVLLNSDNEFIFDDTKNEELLKIYLKSIL